MLYQVHLAWAGFELTMLVVVGTDCIGSYKSNYHTTKTTTNPWHNRFNTINPNLIHINPIGFVSSLVILKSGYTEEISLIILKRFHWLYWRDFIGYIEEISLVILKRFHVPLKSHYKWTRLNAIFNHISFFLVEETGVPRENHWPVASHWQTLSHNVASGTSRHERYSNSRSWW
jgi:hypothetical protein